MSHNIGLVQMRSTNQLDDNLKFAHQHIRQAADSGIYLLPFPETF